MRLVLLEVLTLVFLFALGASLGSFMNVVVYRLPLGKSIVSPPSACPKCNTPLAWRDNIPVLGWLLLRGKCRYCGEPISMRYPIVELLCGLLPIALYIALYHLQLGPHAASVASVDRFGFTRFTGGPLTFAAHWPMFIVYVSLLYILLTASLIDAEHFIIPLELCYLLAIVALAIHTIYDTPGLAGNVLIGPMPIAMTLAAVIGLFVAIGLLRMKVLRTSFADAAPLLEHEKDKVLAARERGESVAEPVDFSAAQIRAEMRHEMKFLMVPLGCALLAGALVSFVPSIHARAMVLDDLRWVSAASGAIFGGLIGGLVVWMTRILGSYAFGREAMGLGDVHLMFGVGVALGAGPATIAFFVAPFFGLALALYMFLFSKRRELPYGPYLSLASVAMIFLYPLVGKHFSDGVEGLGIVLRSLGS